MTQPSLKHVALDGAVQVVSSLTDRAIWVNSAMDKYSVTPHFSVASLRSVRKEWSELFGKDQTALTRSAGKLTFQLISRILSAKNRGAFARALDRAFSSLGAVPERTHGRQYAPGWISPLQIANAVVLCVKHDLLLFPPMEMLSVPSGARSPRRLFRGRSLPAPTAERCGQSRAAVMQALVPTLAARVGASGTAYRLLLSIGGWRDLGDIGPEVFSILRPVLSGDLYREMQARRDTGNPHLHPVIDMLLTLQREHFADDDSRLVLIPKDYLSLRFKLEGPPPPAPTYDRTFSWIRNEHPDKVAWQQAASDYLSSLYVVTTESPIRAINQVLQALFSRRDTPDSPLEFCLSRARQRSTGALRSILLNTDESGAISRSPVVVARHISHIERFFTLLLETHAVLESGALDPAYMNPAVALRAEAPKVSQKGETEREAVPDEVKEELIEALTAPVRDPITGRVVWTFAWAKSIDTDHFAWVNPDTKKTERVWSPVRALALLFMLHSPLRGLQLRFLGSGEADPEVWVPNALHPRSGIWGEMWAPNPNDVHGGEWIANTSKWAVPPAKGSARVQRFTGVVRRFHADDGTEYLGTYVSTNKTADMNVNPEKFGYEIPLILPVNLEIIEYLTAWQARFNPATAPKSRTNLHTVRDKGSEKIKGRYPPMHYLFRDAAVRHSDEPVSEARLRGLWELLNHHLDESRKVKGKPPFGLVVTYRHLAETQLPSSVKYTLHSLRVTAVTEMAENGVPFPVIAAMCGHARWVMSAYYVKLRPGFIRDSIRDAHDRTEERVRIEANDAEWKESYLKADPLADISLLAGASDVVIPQLRATQRALVKIMDHGFCVFGGARCHDGGPVISVGGNRLKRGAVPGGPTNCPACNWFGSGVPWIPALLSYYNAMALDLSLAVERFEAADAAYSSLVKQQQKCARLQQSFDYEQMQKPRRTREQAAAIRRDVAERMDPVFRWLGKCADLIAKGSDGKPQVVISNEVRTLIVRGETATITDQALQTLKDSEVYAFDPMPAATVVGKALSHALSHGGIDFNVLSLSASELAAAVAQFEQLVRRRHGGMGLRDVFNNRATLESLGIEEDVRAYLSEGLQRIPEQELARIAAPSAARLLAGA